MSYINKNGWFRDDVKRRVQEIEESVTPEELKERLCFKIHECMDAIVQTELIVEKHPEFDTGDLIGGRGLFLYALYRALEDIERVERRESRREYYTYDRDR